MFLRMRRNVQANLTIWVLIVGIAFVTLLAAVAYLTRDEAEIERIQRMERLSDTEG